MQKEQEIPFRNKAADGSYVNPEDIERQERMLDTFRKSLPKSGWKLEASLGKFDHADAEVYRNDKFIGLAEAKFRDRFDKSNPYHCVQIGMDKIVGIWDKYAPNWRGTGKVVPIVLVSEIYKQLGEPDLGTEIYAISLGHLHPWLYQRAKNWDKTNGDPKRFYDDMRSTSKPQVRWVENKYSDKAHGHHCLWIPLDWCALVEPGMDIAAGIYNKSLNLRSAFTSPKFWEDEVQEEIE
jgi:hypothetical protein